MNIIDIISTMEEPLDFVAFKAKAAGTGMESLNAVQYYQNVGIYLGARYQYPDMQPYDAFARVHGINHHPPASDAGIPMVAPAVDDADIPLSLLARGKNLAAELWKWGKSGAKLRSEAEYDRIFSICQGCELKRDLVLNMVMCDHMQGGCGCSMNIKIWMETTTCKQGKW